MNRQNAAWKEQPPHWRNLAPRGREDRDAAARAETMTEKIIVRNKLLRSAVVDDQKKNPPKEVDRYDNRKEVSPPVVVRPFAAKKRDTTPPADALPEKPTAKEATTTTPTKRASFDNILSALSAASSSSASSSSSSSPEDSSSSSRRQSWWRPLRRNSGGRSQRTLLHHRKEEGGSSSTSSVVAAPPSSRIVEANNNSVRSGVSALTDPIDGLKYSSSTCIVVKPNDDAAVAIAPVGQESRPAAASDASAAASAAAGAARAAASSSASSAPSSPTSDPAAKILVVDDCKTSRRLLARRVEKLGHAADTAADGREALDLLMAAGAGRGKKGACAGTAAGDDGEEDMPDNTESEETNKRQYDLVLLDMFMPNLNGDDVLRAMRDDDDLRSIPVVMISGSEDVTDKARCIDLGAKDFLPKPFEPRLFRARVGACLQAKRIRDLERSYLRQVENERTRLDTIVSLKVELAEERSCQDTTHLLAKTFSEENSRLRSDLRAVAEERDALREEAREMKDRIRRMHRRTKELERGLIEKTVATEALQVERRASKKRFRNVLSANERLRQERDAAVSHCNCGDEETCCVFRSDVVWKNHQQRNVLTNLKSMVLGGEKEQRLPAAGQAAASPGPDRAKVLVVEDCKTSRRLLVRRVEKLGHLVDTASDGRTALDLLLAATSAAGEGEEESSNETEEKQYDLVLLDMFMPNLNGDEVLRTMKENDDLRHVPVLMISGSEDVAHKARCIDLGAADFLPKPFEPDLFRARVGACLEAKRVRDRERSYYLQQCVRKREPTIGGDDLRRRGPPSESCCHFIPPTA